MRDATRSRILTALAVTLPLGAIDPSARLSRDPVPVPVTLLEDGRSMAALGAILLDDDSARFACAAVLVRSGPESPIPAAARYRALDADERGSEIPLSRRDSNLAPRGFERWDGCVAVPRRVREARLALDIGRPGVADSRRLAWVEIRTGRWTWRPVRAPRTPFSTVAGAPAAPGSDSTAERSEPSDPHPNRGVAPQGP